MVPNITTILPRFTAEWAVLRPPDAILTVCREIGFLCTRFSRPRASKCTCPTTPPDYGPLGPSFSARAFRCERYAR